MGTPTFWQRKKYQIIGATLGVVFHSLLLVVMMGGTGTIAVFLMLFDFPIYIFLLVLDDWFGYFGNEWFEVSMGVGGTLMYAVIGWKAHSFFARHPELFPHAIEDTHKNSIQHDHQDEENLK